MKLSRWASLRSAKLSHAHRRCSPFLADLSRVALLPKAHSHNCRIPEDSGQRTYLAHSPIPTANERETEPTEMAIDAMYQRVSLFRWILILLSAGGAVLVIMATGSTGGESEETPLRMRFATFSISPVAHRGCDARLLGSSALFSHLARQ